MTTTMQRVTMTQARAIARAARAAEAARPGRRDGERLAGDTLHFDHGYSVADVAGVLSCGLSAEDIYDAALKARDPEARERRLERRAARRRAQLANFWGTLGR